MTTTANFVFAKNLLSFEIYYIIIVEIMKNKVREPNNQWLKLDNAALVYPSSSDNNWNNVFRVSAYLNEDVNPEILQKALNVVIERFPNLDVTLRRGVFWYYFQPMTDYPKVEEEKLYPCRRMELNKKKHLFRVLYYKNKISFETFHALTDGSGGVNFLNCLVACYLNLMGKDIDDKKLAISYKDRPNEEEIQDSFKHFADNSGASKRSTKKAYQIHGTPLNNGVLDVISAVVDCEKLKQVAKQHGATITEFLVAVYASCIINYQKQHVAKKSPVIVSVPVNLRRFFDTKTFRNFSSWLDVCFEGKDKKTDLDSLIELTKQQMATITKESMTKNINANIKTEKNPFVRILPLFIKNFFVHLSYQLFGEKAYTTVLTNVGKVDVPKEFYNHVQRYDFLLCKSMINTINIAVLTYNNKLSITFTSSIKEKTIQRNFVRMLKSLGIDVTIYSNIK